jgi:hypothetical protein
MITQPETMKGNSEKLTHRYESGTDLKSCVCIESIMATERAAQQT